MTGPVAKTPKTNAEWARNVQKKLDANANPTTVRIGGWVLSQDAATGNLLASNDNGGTIVLASIPDSVETPDAKVSTLPWFRGTLSNAAGIAIPAAAWTQVAYDSIEGQSDDAWGADKSGFTNVTVPATGVYSIQVKNAWMGQSTQMRYSGLSVNGVIIEAGGHYASNAIEWPITNALYKGKLSKGDVVAGWCYSSIALNIGVSGFPGTAIFTTLALQCIETL